MSRSVKGSGIILGRETFRARFSSLHIRVRIGILVIVDRGFVGLTHGAF